MGTTTNEPVKIAFKRGLQSNLSKTTIENGTFYLTTDTNRLYVGQPNGTDGNKLALLNQTVQIIDTKNNLPSENPEINDFYYCVNENILAVYTEYTDENKQKVTGWRQVNPDTDTNTNNDIYITGGSAAVSTDSDNKKIKVTTTLNRTNKDYINNEETEDSISYDFELTKADLNAILQTSVGLDVSSIDGGAKIGTIGEGSDSKNIVNIIKADDSVKITVDTDDVKIQGTTYDFTATNNEIILENNLINDTQTINLVDDDVVILEAKDNTISASHKDYTPTKTSESKTLNPKDSFTIIENVSTEKGHITGYTEKTFTLPEDKDTKNAKVEIDANASGDLNISITDTANDVIDNTKDTKGKGVLYYTVNGSRVYNQGSIEFYTKDQLDIKFNAIDAMTYKGTVGGTGSTVTDLPTDNVRIGDTYKVAKKGTYETHSCEVGDLLIATGTETGGVITSDVIWTYIPSGSDTDTTYTLSVANQEILLTSSTGNDSGKVPFTGDSKAIDIETINNSLKISHRDLEKDAKQTESKQAPNHGGTFTVIKEMVVNGQGHITSYTPSTVTLPTDNNTTYGISIADDDGTTKSAQIKLDSSDNNDDDSITIQTTTDYLTIEGTSADKLTINHKDYSTTLNGTSETPNSISLNYDGEFTVVSEVNRDAGGHLSGYKTKTLKMPSNTNETFTLSGDTVSIVESATEKTATFTTSLTGSKNNNSTSTRVIKTTSTNIDITQSGNNGISIDLIWGSF